MTTAAAGVAPAVAPPVSQPWPEPWRPRPWARPSTDYWDVGSACWTCRSCDRAPSVPAPRTGD
jgi:hypothetical protein